MAKTLGHRVLNLRREKNWTQQDLANAIKRINPEFSGSQSTIQAIERGASKKPTIMWELAQALDTTVDFLRYGAEFRSFKEEASQYLPPIVKETTKIKAEFPTAKLNLDIKAKPTDDKMVSNILEATHGAFLALGLSEEVSDALVELILEVAEEPPIPGVPEDGPVARRILSASATRRFLKTKQL